MYQSYASVEQARWPRIIGLSLLFTGLVACEQGTSSAPKNATQEQASMPGAQPATQTTGNTSVECVPDNGGLILPAGFCASVVADDLGDIRHLAVNDNGDIYVRLEEENNGGVLVALRDENDDGKADRIEYFGDDPGGTGLEIHNGYLYYAADEEGLVFRVALAGGELVPSTRHEIIVSELPQQTSHEAKSLALDDAGNLYVNIGAPSNSCQVQDRTPESPGQDPCPLLEQHAGIWQFDAATPNQSQEQHGHRFASGIRNMVALDWNPVTGNLYGAQHGRDQLTQNWGYTELAGALLPAEEVFLLNDGDNFGWPYAYYDHIRQQKLLMPEYGGDGVTVGRASQFEEPIIAFPGHWAPNDLVFYTGNQFPLRYHGGMFIAFHGSWNRAPLPQGGYRVSYVPFDGDVPIELVETFANGFKGTSRLEVRENASYRPTGLAVGPEGSLYISDDHTGRIWRVVYKGGNAGSR